jgi:hypothetical protein
MWFLSRNRRQETGHNIVRPNRFLPRLDILEDRSLPSTLTVLNTLDSGSGSLRDAIGHAKDGDTIVFAPSLNGQTITLTSDQLTLSKSLDIEGPGASLLAISGGDINRVFNVNEGFTVTIAGLTITHGRAGGSPGSDSAGGGVLNVGSTLHLANDVFSYNVASGVVTAGGAIANRNGGNLTVTSTTFLANQATARATCEGGAIANTLKASTLTVSNCMFIGNQAVGSDGAEANGGAIENDGDIGGATANICDSTFTANRAVGGDGGVVQNTHNASGEGNDNGTQIGIASGGAIVNTGGLTLSQCTFTANRALAGNGGNGGKGASLYLLDQATGGAIVSFNQAILTVDGCSFSSNQAIGGSNATGGASGQGRIGIANGGALANLAIATITNTAFDANLALGGNGDTSFAGDLFVGAAIGGGIASNPFAGVAATSSISNVTFQDNQATGGTANTGAAFSNDALGGGLALRFGATATIAGTTFAGNQALAGMAASGNGADGLGGGIANILGSTCTVSGCTLTGNQAIGGAGGADGNGGNGLGGGIYSDGLSIWPANVGTPATLTITVSTISTNQARGSAAGAGGSVGQGVGGGVYFASGGVVCLDLFTSMNITGNTAPTSNDDVFGVFAIC